MEVLHSKDEWLAMKNWPPANKPATLVLSADGELVMGCPTPTTTTTYYLLLLLTTYYYYYYYYYYHYCYYYYYYYYYYLL